jgi:hypothetical protein
MDTVAPPLRWGVMIARQLIRKLARQARVSEAQAADSLDELVHGIVQRLKRKEPVEVPGVARLVPGADGKVVALPLQTPTGNRDASA